MDLNQESKGKECQCFMADNICLMDGEDVKKTLHPLIRFITIEKEIIVYEDINIKSSTDASIDMRL